MKDFIFRNDTKLLFRNDIRETIAEVTKGHKVMFVYGSGSVKRNGCYNDIIRTLTDADIHFVELLQGNFPKYKRVSGLPSPTA